MHIHSRVVYIPDPMHAYEKTHKILDNSYFLSFTSSGQTSVATKTVGVVALAKAATMVVAAVGSNGSPVVFFSYVVCVLFHLSGDWSLVSQTRDQC